MNTADVNNQIEQMKMFILQVRPPSRCTCCRAVAARFAEPS
jgi:hypothetical protein